MPDKITDTMGIVADVNLLYEGTLEYIEIIVDKYPSLISFRGKYYYRSGSTMRTIVGAELDKAMLKSHGRTWDGIALPRVTVEDLKQSAIEVFKEKAVKSGRLTAEDVDVENRILMENLNLYEDDNLIRAAVLSFYHDPEKWVTGSYIKIGFFVTDSDLRYHDEVNGPLIEQIDRTVELVYTKYLKALIYYEGIQRVEKFMFPREAFREILINAVIHKDYSSCNPIQISVYDDKLYIWNSGEMPPSLSTTEKLFMKHSSIPFNPNIARVFFRSGMIEAWGRSFEKIKRECDNHGTPLPEYDISVDGVMVLCKPNDIYMKLLNGAIDPFEDTISTKDPVINVIGADNGINDTKDPVKDLVSDLEKDTDNKLVKRNEDKSTKEAIIELMRKKSTISAKAISEVIGITSRAVEMSISELKEEGLITRVGTTRSGHWIVN
jgi:ATP-dependent DNA helicase RecG